MLTVALQVITRILEANHLDSSRLMLQIVFPVSFSLRKWNAAHPADDFLEPIQLMHMFSPHFVESLHHTQ
jgi:hypothetical protein